MTLIEVSSAGDHLIQEFETFCPHAYLDSKKVPTIGFGTTRVNGQPVTLGMTCTMEQALEWKRQDLSALLTSIAHWITVELTQNQIDALASFVYNVGVAAFQRSSLLRAINARQPITEDLFTRWDKIWNAETKQFQELDGLLRRRKAEYALYIQG